MFIYLLYFCYIVARGCIQGAGLYQVLGTKYFVPNACSSTKNLVPTSWHRVLGTKYDLVPRTCYKYQVLGTKDLETGQVPLATKYLVPSIFTK